MTIPRFPEFKAVDLSLKDAVHAIISENPIEASEYTFTNIFAFRDTYNFKLSLLNDNLIILKDKEPVSVFCPVGGHSIPETLDLIFEFLSRSSREPCIERVPESFAREHLQGAAHYINEEIRDHFDYLYEVHALIELKGRKFHDKKNRVNSFRKTYDYEYLTLTPDLIGECLEFEDYWCEVKECEKYFGLKKERCAVLAMMNNFEALHLKGGAIKINDKIAALTLGEQYLPDTMLVHVEKANPDIPGLYQMINREFLMHEAGDCTYVNREQDLGIEGLRKAKMSYHPVKFNKKSTVRKK